jgi:ribose/xylose/arabinose/galactoside ABC-type transport system permease subunit
MDWDLGLQGLAVLAAISLGFGVLAGLIVGRGSAHRLLATAITAVACFGVGLVTSEVLFGWATEEELQPNVDGLSRDEVLLAGVLTTAVVVLVMRYLAHRAGGDAHDDRPAHGGRGAGDTRSNVRR